MRVSPTVPTCPTPEGGAIPAAAKSVTEATPAGVNSRGTLTRVPLVSSLFPDEQLQHAHVMPRQPMGEGETQVAMAPGRDYLDGQSSTTDACLSRLQLGDR